MYYNFFERMNWKNRAFSWEKIACLILAVVVGIGAGIWVCQRADMTPATPEDYAELYAKLELVQNNHEIMFQSDGNIEISDGVITYEVKNNECIMTGKYNQEFELIETSQTDRCDSASTVAFMAALGTFFFGLGAAGIAYVVIGIVELTVITVIVVFKIVTSAKRKGERGNV